MPKELIKKLEIILKTHENKEIAIKQEAYMRNKFKFLGIKKPVLKKEIKKFIRETKIVDKVQLVNLIQMLWSQSHREYHYAALDISLAYKGYWDPELLVFFKNLIITNSWWDTVDEIAPKLVGNLIKKYSYLDAEIDSWVIDENFWIRRASLIYQLGYKEKTNTQKLFFYCIILSNEKEFFIRKAIGWSLRQYSKTNHQAVKEFLIQNKDKLSYLSFSQASKYINWESNDGK